SRAHNPMPYAAPASQPATVRPVVPAITASRTNWTPRPTAGPRPQVPVAVPVLNVTMPPGGKIGSRVWLPLSPFNTRVRRVRFSGEEWFPDGGLDPRLLDSCPGRRRDNKGTAGALRVCG